MAAAIRIEGLGKRYRLARGGQRAEYRTLRESLVGAVTAPFRRRAVAERSEEFWALRDVSIEVPAGEVVGVIGRNGAGKSTLLKILSRITKPTTGRVEINGRVGSLLEVGTGFHPELTGRENVFLNGSILGMSRAEIARKFDAIVAFSEVEQFLDTPVKRYSSGMYVRLAFAVAAHLEPEILIVDEVLAVGDAGFQAKCFAKMGELRRSGRTVLVVSHNLGAILNICTTAVNMEQGRVMGQGAAGPQVTWYLNRLAEHSRKDLSARTDREGDQTVKVVGVSFLDDHGRPLAQAVSGEPFTVRLACRAEPADAGVDYAALSCWTGDGVKVLHVDNLMTATAVGGGGALREYRCRFPRPPLPPGLYHWNVALTGGGTTRDHVYSAATLEVLAGDYFGVGRNAPVEGGMVYVDHAWAAAEGVSA